MAPGGFPSAAHLACGDFVEGAPFRVARNASTMELNNLRRYYFEIVCKLKAEQTGHRGEAAGR